MTHASRDRLFFKKRNHENETIQISADEKHSNHFINSWVNCIRIYISMHVLRFIKDFLVYTITLLLLFFMKKI